MYYGTRALLMLVYRISVRTLQISPHNRDGEAAYVSLNDVECWTATGITDSQGTEQCGAQGIFTPRNEDAIPVTGCSVALSGSGYKPVTVRVWTNLDGRNAKEESFGIANVVIQNHEPSRSNRTRCMLQ